MSVTINGSGTIGGLSAGGLPDGTIQQADLATNVAGNGPAFRAFKNASAQTVTSAVSTKIVLDGEVFDTASCFNNTGSTVNGIPAYAFMPNVAGYYQFNACVYGSSSTLYYNYVQFWKNGGQDSASIVGPYQGSASIAPLSSLIYLNGSTDYVELYTQIYGTAPITVYASTSLTFFSGALVRAA